MAIDIFVSYSSRDRAKVAKVVESLEKTFIVWWDRDLISGTDYAVDIFSKIERTAVVVIAWSANSASSEWVLNEVRAAENCHLIPLLLDDTPLPTELAWIDACDMRNWDGDSDHDALDKLVRDIQIHKSETKRASSEAAANVPTTDRSESEYTWSEKLGLHFFGFPLGIIFAFYFLDYRRAEMDFGLIFPLIYLILYIVVFITISKKNKWRQIFVISLGFVWVLAMPYLSYMYDPEEFKKMHPEQELNKANVRLEKDYCINAESKLKKVVVKNIEANSVHRPSDQEAAFIANMLKSSVGVAALLSVADGQSKGDSLKAMSSSDEYYAAGCVPSDWQILTASSNDDLVRIPYFAPTFDDGLSASGKAKWVANVRNDLKLGKFDDARAALGQMASTNPAAANYLGVLEALELGRDAAPQRAHMLFKSAALNGDRHATANLGLTYIFGIGTHVSTAKGVQLLDQAIASGLNIEDATWLFVQGPNLLRASSFVEVAKSLRMAANDGSGIAEMVLAVMATRGISHPACTIPCKIQVDRHVARLQARGLKSFVSYVEANRRTSGLGSEGLPGVAGILHANASELKNITVLLDVKDAEKNIETISIISKLTNFFKFLHR